MATETRQGGPTGNGRRLSIAEASFYAAVYSSARKGSLSELRRWGCSEEEAEEIFTGAFEWVMKTVDPIAREFSEAQMVTYVKRTCWFHLLGERNRRDRRSQVGLETIRSLSDPGSASPAEIAEGREAVAIGREAVQMLSERDRSIFRQRHQMNRSPEEILRSTPGLSLRTYRKIIQHANARVLAAFERIQTGERCEEMRAGMLRRYVGEESPEAERREVKAHLVHCRSCRRTQAEMRGYLGDVASVLAVTSSMALRERIRDAFLRVATGMPGSGGDPAMGQALSASAAKVGSACAGLAVSVCLATGVVPGLGGVGPLNHEIHAKGPPTKKVAHATSPPAPQMLVDPLPTTKAAPATSGKTEGSSTRGRADEATGQATEPSTAKPASPTSNSPSDARLSSRQTGVEMGAESAGEPLTVSPLQSEPSGGLSKGGAAIQSGQGAAPNSGSGSPSEFGM